MSELMINLENVHKIYTLGEIKVHALNGIDVKIKKGEFVTVMGPSGSGKSTLLHIIGVLDSPTKGRVFIDKTDVTALTDEQATSFRLSELGFVFQFYSLLPELTASENVFLPQLLQSKSRSECMKNARMMMERVGLGERMSNYPSQLSGGEQQRVSIARAMVNNPKILLADEPTASLDTKSGQNIINTFRKLNEDFKQTIVMITHEEELGRQADRGIWIKDGIVEKERVF